jgi:aminoglycoside N3'-acetyltransferase
MEGHKGLNELLDKLNIAAGDVVYLHTSFKRLSYLKTTGEEFIATLLNRLGKRGTLVLPSFAWNLDKTERPWKGYREYFETRPVFDVKRTAANIGWIPELFRAMPDVLRSMDYWWPVCARGALASEITAGQERVEHPYGPGSSFDMLRVHDVKILGLGVTLNTTSLALIPDYVLGARHTQRVFTQERQRGVVRDYEGREIETLSYWLLPDVVRLVKPSALIEESERLRQEVLRADEGTTIHFSYPYRVYHEEALRLGEEAVRAGRPVPWLKNYPLKEQGAIE